MINLLLYTVVSINWREEKRHVTQQAFCGTPFNSITFCKQRVSTLSKQLVTLISPDQVFSTQTFSIK